MAGIVERRAVHQHEILVDAAAAHAETGGAFARRLHAGHHLDHPDDVGLPHQRRQFADDVAADRLHPELRQGQLFPFALGKHLGRFQQHVVFFQFEVVLERGFGVDLGFRGHIAGIGTLDDLFLPVDLQRIKAIIIGRHAGRQIRRKDHRSDERLSAGSLLHISRQNNFLPGRRQDSRQQEQPDEGRLYRCL